MVQRSCWTILQNIWINEKLSSEDVAGSAAYTNQWKPVWTMLQLSAKPAYWESVCFAGTSVRTTLSLGWTQGTLRTPVQNGNLWISLLRRPLIKRLRGAGVPPGGLGCRHVPETANFCSWKRFLVKECCWVTKLNKPAYNSEVIFWRLDAWMNHLAFSVPLTLLRTSAVIKILLLNISQNRINFCGVLKLKNPLWETQCQTVPYSPYLINTIFLWIFR